MHLSDEQVTKKMDALRCYAMELRPYPHPFSEKAVTFWMGMRGSAFGVEAAEVFILARGVW